MYETKEDINSSDKNPWSWVYHNNDLTSKTGRLSMMPSEQTVSSSYNEHGNGNDIQLISSGMSEMTLNSSDVRYTSSDDIPRIPTLNLALLDKRESLPLSSLGEHDQAPPPQFNVKMAKDETIVAELNRIQSQLQSKLSTVRMEYQAGLTNSSLRGFDKKRTNRMISICSDDTVSLHSSSSEGVVHEGRFGIPKAFAKYTQPMTNKPEPNVTQNGSTNNPRRNVPHNLQYIINSAGGGTYDPNENIHGYYPSRREISVAGLRKAASGDYTATPSRLINSNDYNNTVMGLRKAVSSDYTSVPSGPRNAITSEYSSTSSGFRNAVSKNYNTMSVGPRNPASTDYSTSTPGLIKAMSDDYANTVTQLKMSTPKPPRNIGMYNESILEDILKREKLKNDSDEQDDIQEATSTEKQQEESQISLITSNVYNFIEGFINTGNTSSSSQSTKENEAPKRSNTSTRSMRCRQEAMRSEIEKQTNIQPHEYASTIVNNSNGQQRALPQRHAYNAIVEQETKNMIYNAMYRGKAKSTHSEQSDEDQCSSYKIVSVSASEVEEVSKLYGSNIDNLQDPRANKIVERNIDGTALTHLPTTSGNHVKAVADYSLEYLNQLSKVNSKCALLRQTETESINETRGVNGARMRRSSVSPWFKNPLGEKAWAQRAKSSNYDGFVTSNDEAKVYVDPMQNMFLQEQMEQIATYRTEDEKKTQKILDPFYEYERLKQNKIQGKTNQQRTPLRN
ncbi:uncharacterized protein BBOV_IV011900 [Babesia bovis T2Bo]|uniref:Uncharacterized protein n=1 Tax=Babesia bovis TaxID=5865 RepID=A7ASM3_BABBO|nr:uncharacterized protein BBOV_IV011900 [Babesia bovis T2Bo]EDO07542.1 hypothetical protein BBOV_IV011900 [Babesia bovis T2Bo]|eukprot:XP_001611110.1 hypothetical protein [Babesia bovis T2Bo]